MGATPRRTAKPPWRGSPPEGKRTLLTHRRLLRSALLRPALPASLLRTPRPVLAKRLALSVLCCGTLAAAGILPTMGPKSDAPSTTKAAAMGAAADRGTQAASRDKQRSASAAPSTSAPAAPAQSAPAPAQAAAPAPAAAPATPATPSIPGLDQYQAENAQTIVNVGTQLGVPT